LILRFIEPNSSKLGGHTVSIPLRTIYRVYERLRKWHRNLPHQTIYTYQSDGSTVQEALLLLIKMLRVLIISLWIWSPVTQTPLNSAARYSKSIHSGLLHS